MAFLNIPNVPGVPPLPSFGGSNIPLLVADAVSILSALFGPQWGIFKDGIPVIAADNTVSFDLKQDLPVADYQVELGGFQSYNKVQLPTQIRVRMSAGGNVLDRQIFLQSIKEEINTVDLYDIVTPEETYLGYNFTHRDIQRADGRVGLIVADLWMVEIRQTSTSTFQDTKTPAVAGQVNSGNPQAQAVTTSPAPSVGEFT